MANSAVIGILKALLTAETGEFQSAMRAAGAEAQELGKKLEKDLEPRQRSINNLVKEFLGGTEIRRAQEYAQAIEKVGGVTALTASDQLKANRAVAEALEHYRKLGIEAPKNLRDIEAATRQVPKAMDGIGASAMKMASALGLAFSAAAVVNGIKNLVGNAIEAAGKIEDLSAKLGISAEAVQRFSFAAEQTGSSIDGIGTAISKMNANLSGGSKDVVSMLKQIGLSFSDIRSMRPEDAFLAIAEAIRKIPDPMLQAEAAMKLFGKSGQDLLPMIKEGVAQLGEQTTVMSDETVKKLDRAKDAWDKFGKGVVVVTGTIIADLIKSAQVFATVFDHAFAVSEAWIKGGSAAAAIAFQKFRIEIALANVEMARAAAHAADLDRLERNRKGSGSTAEERAAEEAARKAAERAAKELAEATKNLQSSLLDLTAAQYDQVAAALASGKAQSDIAKVYKLTSQQVSDVAASEKGLADLRKKNGENEVKLLKLLTTLDDKLAKQLLDNVKLKLKGIDQIDDAERKFASDQFNRTATSLEKQIAAARERERAMKASFSGSIEDQKKYFAVIEAGTEAHIANLTLDWENAFKDWSNAEKAALLARQEALGREIGSVATGVMDAVQRAIEGGGNPLLAAIGQLGNALGDKLGKAIGDGIGGKLGTAVGGVVGAAAGGILSYFSSVMASEASAAERSADALRRMRDLQKELRNLGLESGMGGSVDPAFLALMQDLSIATHDAQGRMRGFNEQLEEMLDLVSGAMGRAGLSMDDLGDATAKMSRSAKQLIADMKILTSQGFTLEQATRGNADALNKLIGAALETGQKIPAALQPMIAQLAKSGLLTDDLKRKLLGLEAGVPWKDMQTVAEKYGIALEALGPRFQQAKLSETAQEFAKDFMLLVDNGADVGAVLDKMGGKANEFLLNAKKWGIELPPSMRPLLQAMVDAGTLIDDNGEKITDLKDIKFGKTLAEELDPLLKKLDELIAVLTKGVPGALNTMVDEANTAARRWPIFGRPSIPVGYATGDDGEPSFANGSGGFRNFGKGTSATLHGWEQVINTDEAQGIAGMVHSAVTTASPTGPITMVWRVNGRDLYRETFPDLVAVLRNAQVTR